MIDGKIRTAVIGCGRVSRTAHYSTLKDNDDFDFVAVCDTDKSRAEEWGAKNGVRAYTSVDDLLDNEELDFVTVNVPNGLHPQVGMMAAERGVHVMCEKPLGMRLDEADELIRLCDEKQVRLFTVMQNRFNATNLLLKNALDKGRFGELLTCNVTVRWHRGLNYYSEDNGWRGKRDMAGGVFTNQSVHYIDTMQWLVGAVPEYAFACMSTRLRPVEVETHGSGIIKFKNGVIGNLDLSVLTYPDDREGSITLMGETGTVKIGGKSMNKILEWDFATPDPEDDEKVMSADYEPPTVYGFGHIEMYRRVARVLKTGRGVEDVPDGREGRKAVEILNALYQSNDTGMPVQFPLGSEE
ncbi:MAG: Gfo/Idh/MocA family oxidoreductase [Alphaproteobacteria bacterium]|nr:Gfo/Idh/MocA family oxidoreductase [Alphaproteobacteria bacterium]MBF0249720.1 Gfo/Idh/MocA family oxidoreductase [Alphaproteobacteria bacterium]